MTDLAATTEAEVVDAVRAARDWKSPLNIVGNRTKRAFGRAVAGWGTVLDLSGLSGVIAYEPEELILSVRPGTLVTEVEALLATKNQRLGFDPADWGPLLGAPANRGTIGGAIAADVAGSGAVRHGRVRDHLLGFRAVNGLGEAYKAGGRVVKNVTGFDLPKLMCGSFGTLGMLTEVTLRVFPKPALSATLSVREIGAEEGFKLLRRVWSSSLDATGLAWIPDAAFIRVEGAAEPLREKLDAVRVLLAGYDVVDCADGDERFRALGDAAAFQGTDLDVWRVSLPPASAARVREELSAPVCYGDWAGGVLWVGMKDTDARLRDIVGKAGGHATLMHASEESRARIAVFHPEPPERAALTRAVKAAFDPLGLFNPGRMYEGV
jgi:glycolate oxidase FAD binding subunit